MVKDSATGVLRLGFKPRRLISGAVAGVAGGLAFGLMLLAQAIGGLETRFQGGIVPAIAQALGTENMAIAWAIHVANSALFGLIFALLVVPLRYKYSVGWALVWAALLWFFGAQLILRRYLGEPLALDAEAVFSLQGHALFGLVMGLVYVWFYRGLGEEAHEHHFKTLEQ